MNIFFFLRLITCNMGRNGLLQNLVKIMVVLHIQFPSNVFYEADEDGASV